MSLVDCFSSTFPYRSRLDACEQTLLGSSEGERVVENFATSLMYGFITAVQFERFCTRLGEILPEPPDPCSAIMVTDQIDNSTPCYCQGPHILAAAGSTLSRIMKLWGFLFATLGRPPTGPEEDDALYRWQQGLVGSQYHLSLRGRRPFFWVTASESLPSPLASTADRVRDLLGLSRILRGFLLEVQLPAVPRQELYRPTVLDALDSPTFYPAVGADGWGITDDLSGPRPTPGCPEAVTPMTELACEVIARGPLLSPPPRL